MAASEYIWPNGQPGTAGPEPRSVGLARPDLHAEPCRASPQAAHTAQAWPNNTRDVPGRPEDTTATSCFSLNSMGCVYMAENKSILYSCCLWALPFMVK